MFIFFNYFCTYFSQSNGGFYQSTPMNYINYWWTGLWMSLSRDGLGRFQRYVCDILTTFFIFETLQMNVISLQDV